MLRHVAVVTAVALCAAMASTSHASAGDKTELICDLKTGICFVVAAGDGTPGSSTVETEPVGVATCTGPLGTVACYDRQFGWFSQADGCYYRQVDPQPPAGDAIWAGRYPAGAVYLATCPGVRGGTGGGFVWWADPPPGFGGTGVTPAQLATEAVRRMRLDGPAIGIVPEPGKVGLVGLPVWMWTSESPRTWGPVSATASVPGLSITATATARQVSWSMGDGSTVVCNTPGTPYEDRFGARSSPTCGHTYTRTSAREANETYPVTATTTWGVSWVGGGQRGSLELERSSTVGLRIGELQVLVQ